MAKTPKFNHIVRETELSKTENRPEGKREFNIIQADGDNNETIKGTFVEHKLCRKVLSVPIQLFD